MKRDSEHIEVLAARAASLLDKVANEFTHFADNARPSNSEVPLPAEEDVRELCELLGLCQLLPSGQRLAREYQHLIGFLQKCRFALTGGPSSLETYQIMEEKYGPLVNLECNPDLDEELWASMRCKAGELRELLLELAPLLKSSGVSGKATGKRRGRDVKYPHCEDEKLILDWEAAKRQGAQQKEFCEKRGVTVKELVKALTRKRKRRAAAG